MQHSQLAPLPLNLPFRIVSKTIGQGAYACIKKGAPLNQSNPVFAVKFIHKEYAARHGRITAKQIQMEVVLHKHIGGHSNIIKFFDTNEDVNWRWIAMELAEGGDLFDKIESDKGVGEEVAHFYFNQLVSAVSYMHSKGVGHRDIKPENILLSEDGDLKIADFGLATLFKHNGQQKLSTTMCGSPPYIAPEVITNSHRGSVKGKGYHPDAVDVWACGVVLFVLLVGNTPWDSPTEDSFEFCDYVRTDARPEDELWHRLPPATLSLLRGMLKVDVSKRFTLETVRQHPWFTQKNAYLSREGTISNPITLATTMFESLQIDLNSDPSAQQSTTPPSSNAMEVDQTGLSSTQPVAPTDTTMAIDWEAPARTTIISNSQPTDPSNLTSTQTHALETILADEPSMSQYSHTPTVPLSRTQLARKFHDIVPSHSLNRFFSIWPIDLLTPLVAEALHRLGVPASASPLSFGGSTTSSAASYVIKVVTSDSRKCPMRGSVVVETATTGPEEGFVEVEFVKEKGDPVEWRRFFKKVVVLCKEAVYRPEE